MKQVASLQYGVVFKKAFCDPEIFSAFIRDLLGMELAVDRVETEKDKLRFNLFSDDLDMMKKGIAHDIFAELTGISAEELKELPDA